MMKKDFLVMKFVNHCRCSVHIRKKKNENDFKVRKMIEKFKASLGNQSIFLITDWKHTQKTWSTQSK